MEEKKICNGCTNEENCETQMNENMTIPYVVHEATEARHERREKRYIIALIIAIALIFVSNVLWLYAWFQYDYVGEEITVDGKDGIASYIGSNGDFNYGESDSTEESTEEENKSKF